MKRRILIIDDSPVDRRFMSAILKSKLRNVEIFESGDSSNVPAQMITNEIALCILDIMMPGKDGYQVLQEIRENPMTHQVPVIVCTGVYDLEGIERILLLGATDFFTKPLSEQDIKISFPLKASNALTIYENLEEIEKLNLQDSLTGVYNRNYYDFQMLLIDKSHNLPLSLAIFDINGLKSVNDKYGFKRGDDLLRFMADTLGKFFKEREIVARIGGDEFSVIMPNTTRQQAIKKINSFLKDFQKNKPENGLVSIAYGLAVKNHPNEQIADILSKAEDQLFKNKLYEGYSIRNKTIHVILNILHEKNLREKQHSERVSDFCEKIALAMAYDENESKKMKTIGLMHDIGKIAIDESILNKNGRLSGEEYQEIMRHPEISYRILSSVPEMSEIAEIILAHHERYDGRGYPRGLEGEDIPLGARIISVADAYDAMTSHRTYRQAMSQEEAIHELKKCAGTQFDPHVVQAFITKVIQ